jgi:hypothetical protein
VGAGQIPAVAVAYDAQGCDLGLGPEWLLGGIQRGGPDAFQQGTDLLDLADHLGDQLLAACAQMPQPTPRATMRCRSAAQPRSPLDIRLPCLPRDHVEQGHLQPDYLALIGSIRQSVAAR